MNEKVKELVEAAKHLIEISGLPEEWDRLERAVKVLETEAVGEMLLKLKVAMECDVMTSTYQTYHPESHDAFLAAINAWFQLNNIKIKEIKND